MPRKILIVDDLASNRLLLREMLGAEYSAIEAASGEEALDILDRDYMTVSAVLLDVNLPGIDGHVVLESIRRDRRFSKMPVIMITASDDEATRIKSLKLSANDFLKKPYSPEVLRHCLENTIALNEATAPAKKSCSLRKRRRPVFSFKLVVVLSCLVSLAFSIVVQHLKVQTDLKTTCRNVTVDFSEIMDSYRHSFRLFEMILQQEIQNADSADEIEDFLKAQDKRLLSIEGGDYDGVYMYYQNRYMYSWDTPYSAYAETGYDATKRPWYIGAAAAGGEIFFSTPYPSYANDYMLATISRLQEDGETVFAYDIKLGEIGRFVDRLNLYDGALALICDAEGNIIGSTNHLYQGGNYARTPEQLDSAVSLARDEIHAEGAKDEGAARALESAVAQRQFVTRQRAYLSDLLAHEGALRYSVSNLSLGYAYSDGEYTCFVITPVTTFISDIVILWAALLFVFISLSYLIRRMLNRNHQILTDALTGLNNRRAFIKYCDSHTQHHADEALGLLMLDLNHFKKINDLYGHAVGDQALLDSAEVLKSACGASAENYFLCRYGGDEFLLAARAVDAEALNRMRALISDSFRRKNQTSITPYVLEASMGISCGICRDKKNVEYLLTLADQAMYDDKKQAGPA